MREKRYCYFCGKDCTGEVHKDDHDFDLRKDSHIRCYLLFYTNDMEWLEQRMIDDGVFTRAEIEAIRLRVL